MADEKLKERSIDDEIESERRNGVFKRSSENGVKRQWHEKSCPRVQTMIEQLGMGKRVGTPSMSYSMSNLNGHPIVFAFHTNSVLS